MLSRPSLNQIKSDLSLLKKYETVIYGSFVKGSSTSRSDIDVAVITRQKGKNIEVWKALLGQIPEKYDLKVFELLPLEIKISIIHNHRVLFGDPLNISEYFYHFIKLWNDVKPRILENKIDHLKEKVKLLKRSAPLQF